jgi:hypothetical protein
MTPEDQTQSHQERGDVAAPWARPVDEVGEDPETRLQLHTGTEATLHGGVGERGGWREGG